MDHNLNGTRPIGLFDVNPNHVVAASALYDVLPLQIVTEVDSERREQELAGMTVVSGDDQFHAMPHSREIHRVYRLGGDEGGVVVVFWFLGGRRPRVVVNAIRGGFDAIAGDTRHRGPSVTVDGK